MTTELSLSTSEVVWLVSAYQLSFAALLLSVSVVSAITQARC